jgi:hypothetical protein
MARHYDELRTDEEAWKHYQADVAAWDVAAGDGISPTR